MASKPSNYDYRNDSLRLSGVVDCNKKKHVNRDANKTTPERRQTTRNNWYDAYIYVIYIFYAGTPRTSIRRFCRR